MMIDATFWVMVSFFAFLGLLIYFKIPQKVKTALDENIKNIQDQIEEADKLKEDAKNILTEHEKKISNSKAEVKLMINKANEEAEKNVIQTNKNFHNLMEAKKKNVEDFLGMIKDNPKLESENLDEDEKTKLMSLSGVKQYPMRVKCATLSWHTLVSAFDENKDEVKTEN